MWSYPIDNGAPVILYRVRCRDGSDYLSKQTNEINYWKQPTVEYFVFNQTSYDAAVAAGTVIDYDHFMTFNGLTPGTK